MVLDIEGTTTPVSFVYDVLFPYARAGLREHLGDPALAARMEALMDQDSKDPELKRIQGEIWKKGYEDGSLRGDVYPDVAPALSAWRTAGITIAIYSSGSVLAQRLLFGSTKDGDLTPLIGAWFDTAVGPKREPASYTRIAAELKREPNALLFVSDVVAELDAATEAGFQAALCARPGNAPQPTHSHFEVVTFEQLPVERTV